MKGKIKNKKYTRKIKLNKSRKLKTKSKKLKTKSKKLKTNKSIIIFLIDMNKIKKMKKMKGGNGTLENSKVNKIFKKKEKYLSKEDKIKKIEFNSDIQLMIDDIKSEVDLLSKTELEPTLQLILLDLVELVGEARVASNSANYIIYNSSPFIKFIIESLNEIAESTLYTLDDVKPEIFIIQTTLSNLKNKLNEIKESFKTINDTN